MAAFKGGYIRHPFMPAYLYDCGIKPLDGFPVKGAIWYQGESNAENIPQHETLFRAIVDCWRDFWKNPQMPFYFVQLSSIQRETWPEFRNSQRLLSLEIPHCGMAVSSDHGNRDDVHPRAKKPVGERFARLALGNDYGKQVECLAPAATGAFLNSDGSVTVKFDSPLSTSDGKPVRGFTVCLTDGTEMKAGASASGENQVILNIPPGCGPIVVRYAWEPFTDANLTGESGLPVSTFETEVTQY